MNFNSYQDGGYRNARGYENLAGDWRNRYMQADGAFNQFDPAYRRSIRDAEMTLGSDPYTDAYTTSKRAQATTGLNDAYQTALARTLAGARSRGVGGGVVEGALAGVETARAGASAQSAANVSNQAIADQERRRMALVQLLGGAAANANGQATQALGQVGNIYQGAAGIYGNLGAAQLQKDQIDYQRKMATINSLAQLGATAAMF